MRTYVNETLFNALPSDLRNVIADTTVVSGHGINDESNLITTDKLYLLSAHEVWSDGTSNEVSAADPSYNNTRQLDYYANLGVTTDNCLASMKKMVNSEIYSNWGLRSAVANSDWNFIYVFNFGYFSSIRADWSVGVSPAFRIS